MSNVHGKIDSMRTMPAGEFKQTCLRLLDEVGASGEPIVITKRGKAVAQLAPVKAGRSEDWLGAMRDKGEIRGDLVAPASEPSEWNALRG
jgi:antitoxin (DNA-binding transcriptional repressor) of toxin-antitoxin stability system